jgi:putative ABC transport system permease protein
MWRVTIKGLLAKKLRLVLVSISVVLGVAFMSGTFVLTDTIGKVFDNLFTDTTKGIDAVVRTKRVVDEDQGPPLPRTPVPESLVPVVAGTPGVRVAEGTVQGIATVIDQQGDPVQNGQAPPLGFSWVEKPLGQANQLVRGHAPRGPTEVVLDEDTASDAKLSIGDRVRIEFLQIPPEEFEVVGISRFGESGSSTGATRVFFEPATAQRVIGTVGTWDLIEVAADDGVSQQQLAKNIRAELAAADDSGTYEVLTGEKYADELSDNVKEGLGFFNTFLLIFAVVALFVGAFIIYNTFSIIVAQRSRELALLRALGASGQQVTGSVAAEAFVVGLLSSVLGLFLGILVAVGIQALLALIGFDLPTQSPVILPRTVVVALVAGTVVTFVSAIAPARRAARVPPVAAMRDIAVIPTSGSRRYTIGGLLTGIGVVLLALALFGDLEWDGVPGGTAGVVGMAAFLVFIGVAMLSPLIARPTARVLGWAPARLRGMSGVLARENAMRNPRRTATTASALMIGLALVTLVAILGASTKQSFNNIFDSSIRADFLVQGKGFFSRGFTPDIASQLRDDLPGAEIVQVRQGAAIVDGDTTRLVAVTPNIESAVDIGLEPGARLGAFADGGVFVFEDDAKDHNWKVGDRIDMTFDKTGTQPVTVQGIFTEDEIYGTSYFLALPTYAENFVVQADDQVMVTTTADSASFDETRAIIERVIKPYPTIEVQDYQEFKDSRIGQFNAILNVLYVLLLLSIVIALIGIVNTLALSIFERTRELGLLRAVGMTRAQVRTMIRDEAVIVSIFGSLLGLVIGLAFGRALISAIDEDNIVFALPVTQLVIFVVLSGLAGFVAGAWPARRAARRDVLDAIEA